MSGCLIPIAWLDLLDGNLNEGGENISHSWIGQDSAGKLPGATDWPIKTRFYCVNTSYLVDRCICPAPCRSRQTLEKKRPELGTGRDR